MGREETGYHEWTEQELVRETVSNFESLEGIDLVEWLTAPTHANLHDLIRVRTWTGKVFRLAIISYTEHGAADIFDDDFDELSH